MWGLELDDHTGIRPKLPDRYPSQLCPLQLNNTEQLAPLRSVPRMSTVMTGKTTTNSEMFTKYHSPYCLMCGFIYAALCVQLYTYTVQ